MRLITALKVLLMLGLPVPVLAQAQSPPAAPPISTPAVRTVPPQSAFQLPLPETGAAAATPALAAPARAPRPPAHPPVRTPRPRATATPLAKPTIPPVAPTVQPTIPATVATPAITIPPQAAFVSLSRIRIIRTQSFDPADVNQLKLRSTAGPDPSQELTQPGTIFEFKIRPAKGWGIISVDDAKLVQVVTNSGAALALQPLAQGGGGAPAGGSGMAGWVLPVDLSPEEGVIQVRTELPPRADAQLAKLTAEFALTVGYRQSVRIMNLKSRLQRPLDIGQKDVSLIVNRIGKDLVELSATGQFEKIGQIIILNSKGEPLEPYSSEVKTVDQNNVPVKKTWALSFAELPPVLGLNADVYPVRKQIKPRYDWQDVPLP